MALGALRHADFWRPQCCDFIRDEPQPAHLAFVAAFGGKLSEQRFYGREQPEKLMNLLQGVCGETRRHPTCGIISTKCSLANRCIASKTG